MALPRPLWLLLPLALCSCSAWQQRADDLQADLEASVAAGLTTKGAFVKRYGAPKSCAAAEAGESCEWALKLSESSLDRTPAEASLTAAFDKSGGVLSGQTRIRRGTQEYLGRAEPRDAVFRHAQKHKALDESVSGSQGWFDQVWGR